MSARMQIVLEEAELRQFRRLARSKGMTLSEWVRQRLRDAGREEPSGPSAVKLATIRAAAAHAYPAPDIDRMLAEIEQGYRPEVGE